MRDGINMARRDIPAVALVTDEFWAQGDFIATSFGMPDIPQVQLPHPVAAPGPTTIAWSPRRSPLSLSPRSRFVMAVLLTADDEAAALEQLHELGCTDGLPVIVPTPERVERMVLAVGHPAETALGEMGPLQGVCTVEKLAAAAVMAGCLPDHMPIVVASALAMMDPAFDLAEMRAPLTPPHR